MGSVELYIISIVLVYISVYGNNLTGTKKSDWANGKERASNEPPLLMSSSVWGRFFIISNN